MSPEKDSIMAQTSPKAQFISGMRSAIPVIFGFIPVGIAFAIMARQAGFSAVQACGMSLSVFAGASQMMVVGMHAQGASILAMIVATFLLNFRHLIMSTCVGERLNPCPTILKLLAGFGVTDESFALFTTEKKERCTVAYFLGMVLVMYSSWNVGTFLGAVASDFLPPIVTASFGIALYAMFIGIIVPGLHGNRRLALLVALTAACNALLTQFMPPSRALIISTLLCAFLGVFFVELEDDMPEEVSDDQR